MKFEKIAWAYLPVFLWMAIIFYVSSMPHLAQIGHGVWDFLAKKLAHIIEYGILFSLFARALAQTYMVDKSLLTITKYALFFSILYAFSDEFHQSFILGRHPAIRDVGIDTIGMLLFFSLLACKNFWHKFKTYYLFHS